MTPSQNPCKRRHPTPPPPSAASPAAPVALSLPGFVADRAEAAVRVERLLRYQFCDRALLEEALTHQSFSDGAFSYQRLEFVGDAALGLAFSNFLYLTNPTLGPGALSTLRAANISTEKLARVAVRHDLYPLLRRKCARLDLLVGQFIESVKQEVMHDLATAPYGGSVVKAPKVLADIVEAIAAAVYVDCKFDLEKLWKVTRWLFEPVITAETVDEQPVTTLHELCQKHGKVAQFETWQKGGMTMVNVFVGGEMVGLGSSEQKVIAKLNAARDALGKLIGGAKQQVLINGIANGLVDEIVELRECKQKLTEQCIGKHWPKPIFKLEKEGGPAHERNFVCSVQVDTKTGTFVTIGDPMSRVKDAENSAAQKMVELLLKL
ncbi:hypothetical protein BDA96_09G100800 [Sorghum bicolor]|uniref:RNase III domain-containing protein n=2 Tax=Sorghum bicolor TaxID=4558 RepID=A0A921U3P2_SORBI|nr:ribonuclease 3-like protein 2 isoform X3 [Sorghum bicolor]EES19313.1 hypothetical protein SORBI_3009G096100 [Sorghum bicolor]KAG0517572.1 hypothetical protein BDA96_09G100800 [Sorghum bicolor]|eukprot:XP_002440883.1 ribonuclease 3-like protein 2 isoform X3 [Sorghum bicolor]